MDDATFAAFVAWLRAEGFSWDEGQLELVRSGTAAGAGVRARAALPPAATMCSIPKAAVLTVRTTACAALLRQHGVRAATRACECMRVHSLHS
jgi:hypothetical protein